MANRRLIISAQYDPPISGCAEGYTAMELETAELTSSQIDSLIFRIEALVKQFHINQGLDWEEYV